MLIRILTNDNYFDVELKEPVDKNVLINAMDNLNVLMLETKDDTTMFINTTNIVSLEVFDTPPISVEK